MVRDLDKDPRDGGVKGHKGNQANETVLRATWAPIQRQDCQRQSVSVVDGKDPQWQLQHLGRTANSGRGVVSNTKVTLINYATLSQLYFSLSSGAMCCRHINVCNEMNSKEGSHRTPKLPANLAPVVANILWRFAGSAALRPTRNALRYAPYRPGASPSPP